ncbi:MAG: rod shape-determining protein MreC [Acidobacteriia bacterium]|nr:rod shape-determining protein MreC [Terriglobia bacterium]
MENFFSRYKNPLVLMLVLFIQVVGLATQVKRSESAKPSGGGGPRLIRVWTVSIITPFEKAFTGTGHFFRHAWSNYIDLHGARKESRELQEQLSRMKMEQMRLREEAGQAKRLQVLLEFKERYVGQTLAAQVIGTSGSEPSRVIYIDKGSKNSTGLRPDLPVITPDGVVGKIKEVFPFTSQVLLVSDHSSGAGVLLQDSRLQGVLKGTSQGQLVVDHVMSDEDIKAGERIVTSGGDGIYPKGVPVGVVISSGKDPETDPFLKIRVKPAANLDKLEEVLVITKMAEEAPSAAADSGPQRAADILSQRLPSAKKQDATDTGKIPASAATPVPSGARPDEKKSAAPAGEKKSVAPVSVPKGSEQKGSEQKAGEQKKKLAVSGQASASPTPSAKLGAETKKPATDQKKTQPSGAAAAGSPATGSPTTKKAKPPVAKPTPAAPAQTGAPAATPTETPASKKPEAEGQEQPPPGGEKPPQ